MITSEEGNRVVKVGEDGALTRKVWVYLEQSTWIWKMFSR